MSVSDFFGELSGFEILVAAIAIGTGSYTIYKNLLEGPKVSLVTGDRVALVKGRKGAVRHVNLLCNLVNNGVKTGTVQRLELTLTTPKQEHWEFVWREFYCYTEDGHSVHKLSDVHAVAVLGKASVLLPVQFRVADSTGLPVWESGRYSFEILGWVNRKNRASEPNLRTAFSVEISAAAAKRLNDTTMRMRPGELSVPVREWWETSASPGK